MATVLCIVVVYTGYSALAYLSFGPDVEVIVTLSLGSKPWPGSTIRLLYVVAVVLTFPLQLFPISQTIESILSSVVKNRESLNYSVGNIWRCFLVWGLALLAIAGRHSLDHIVSLLGALASVIYISCCIT